MPRSSSSRSGGGYRSTPHHTSHHSTHHTTPSSHPQPKASTPPKAPHVEEHPHQKEKQTHTHTENKSSTSDHSSSSSSSSTFSMWPGFWTGWWWGHSTGHDQHRTHSGSSTQTSQPAPQQNTALQTCLLFAQQLKREGSKVGEIRFGQHSEDGGLKTLENHVAEVERCQKVLQSMRDSSVPKTVEEKTLEDEKVIANENIVEIKNFRI